MNREIILDTETTGLDARDDRIIEIGAVELVNRFPTGRTFHVYINPQGRNVSPEAEAIHGISNSQLAEKPPFPAVADEFLAFIDGAKLIAHNASFDMAFLNAELARIGEAIIQPERVVDTLALARRRHPMGPNSLDALCRRYGIDNSRRTKHGALLDSELLAEVFLELVGGRQAVLGLEVAAVQTDSPAEIAVSLAPAATRAQPLPSRLTDAELQAHARLIAEIGEKALWARFAL